MYRKDRTLLAEQALYRLSEVRVRAQSAMAVSRKPPRLRAVDGPSRSSDADVYGNCVTSIVSISEVFVDSWFQRLLGEEFRERSPNLERMAVNVERSQSANWNDRAKVFKEYYMLDLKDSPDFGTILAANEARNSIMHGLGQLTRRQRSDASTLPRLQLIDVRVDTGNVIVGADAFRIVDAGAVKFIDWLDEKALDVQRKVAG